MYSRIFLKPNRDVALRRFHPWVFSGAIARVEGQTADGDVVEVVDNKGAFLALGHYHDGSIMVKILTFEQTEIDVDFWLAKLSNALSARKLLNLQNTNCYRLVHGEGDGLSGLIIDIYNGVAVLQAHTIGMYKSSEQIAEALVKLFGTSLAAVYQKSKETLPDVFSKNVENGYLYGQSAVPQLVSENGHSFLINWETGQKTGFFLDQRDNRALLAHYAHDKDVLNAFCYSGGFSVYALAAGAKNVVSIDASQKAIDLVNQNVVENFGQEPRHEAITDDVLRFFKDNVNTYDIVILDPPAFAKNLSARHRAVQGYKRLNIEGLKRVRPNGLLFTFSCSQVVDNALFYNTIVSAAVEVGRRVRVLHQISQAPDHPVNFFHPEGHYLKGLVLAVE